MDAQEQMTDTRLGKLTFENGFPTEETARKLFDEMDFQPSRAPRMISGFEEYRLPWALNASALPMPGGHHD